MHEPITDTVELLGKQVKIELRFPFKESPPKVVFVVAFLEQGIHTRKETGEYHQGQLINRNGVWCLPDSQFEAFAERWGKMVEGKYTKKAG